MSCTASGSEATFWNATVKLGSALEPRFATTLLPAEGEAGQLQFRPALVILQPGNTWVAATTSVVGATRSLNFVSTYRLRKDRLVVVRKAQSDPMS